MKFIRLAAEKADAGLILTVSAVLALSIFSVLSAAQELPFITDSGEYREESFAESDSAESSGDGRVSGLYMDFEGEALHIRGRDGETVMNCEFPEEGDLMNLSFSFRTSDGAPVQDVRDLTGSWALVFNPSKSESSLCRVRRSRDGGTLIFTEAADIDYDPAHSDCRIQDGTFYYIDPDGNFSRLELTDIHAQQEKILSGASRLFLEEGSEYACVVCDRGLYSVSLEDPWDYRIVE